MLGPCSIAYNPLACVAFPVYALPVVIGPVSLGGLYIGMCRCS